MTTTHKGNQEDDSYDQCFYVLNVRKIIALYIKKYVNIYVNYFHIKNLLY